MTVATSKWPDDDSHTARSDLDDIDGRAAQLMAQIAARRTKRVAAEPAEPDEDFHTENQPELEYQPASTNEFEFEAVDLEAAESATDSSTGTEADDSIIPEPSEPDNDATWQTRSRHRSTRRMATPPWQTPATSMSRPVHASPDFVERLTDARFSG